MNSPRRVGVGLMSSGQIPIPETCRSPKLDRPETVDFSIAWQGESGDMLAILLGLFRDNCDSSLIDLPSVAELCRTMWMRCILTVASLAPRLRRNLLVSLSQFGNVSLFFRGRCGHG
jgi:hypothetical protein